MQKTVVVTGGAGFIGSHVCKELSRAGYLPVVFDNLSNGHRESVRWGPLTVGDVADAEALLTAFKVHSPHAVIHLAGYIAAGESVEDPAKYYGNNLRTTLMLLEVMRETKVSKIVFSSSAAVYGTPDGIPIKETAPMLPTNPYGHTKLMSEQMLRDHSNCGISSISLRYFNAAGADPDGELGERHEPETHLIPLVLETAAGLRSHVDVFGDHYPTPDGTCIRDYIHVSDLARAHVLALKRLENADGAMAFNLGNGNGFSVLDVISAAEQVTGRNVPVVIRDPRPGDPVTLVADATRARAELDWRQEFGDLEIQIRHAWNWHLRTAGIRTLRPARNRRAEVEPRIATN
ncbi:MAG: UDP-glucose 4-epimerase GalE [Rhodospirillales bacterium CG15_BIG_FIL_POST_REV_8_21_14_020_66_15]|nr:MAG: UDP-glucose 4-epimerase GalE [Rhodospirillales bacterium CG15_BIG_FIL_POST_REV_8_21_14_020_66_15]